MRRRGVARKAKEGGGEAEARNSSARKKIVDYVAVVFQWTKLGRVSFRNEKLKAHIIVLGVKTRLLSET